ncbi:MAG: DUF4382 domain-containing protein [Chitinophagales bacterium]
MRNLKYVTLFLVCLGFAACKTDDGQTSEMNIYLQDAPASAYEKIKIEVKGVSVYSQTSGTWVTLTVNDGIFDLLTLDSLHQAFLGKIKIAGGSISDVRLIIGNQNNVTISGIDHPIILDSTDLDKLTVKISNNISSSSSYKMTIDFKASESIDDSGGVYKLKASLKVTIKSI